PQASVRLFCVGLVCIREHGQQKGVSEGDFCMYCGRLQQHEIHVWASDDGEYFEDGSCETMATCLRCRKTVITGINHAGRISFWNAECKRCGKYMGDVNVF